MLSFGANIMLTDRTLRSSEVAQAVEARGLDALLFSEHTHIPVQHTTPSPLPEDYFRTLDPLMGIAAAIPVTSRIKLGTCVLLAVEHDPITLAKAIATLDVMSKGRVLLGVGVGGLREENADHGVAPHSRWRMMREKLMALREIWTHEKATFEGALVRFPPLISNPKPVQPGGPPILLGVRDPRFIARAARPPYDGWMPTAARADLAGGLKLLRESAERIGRDPSELKVVVAGLAPAREQLEPLIELGLDNFLFRLPSAGADEIFPLLDRCAELARRMR
ncbi:MAG TPA: TIGR03619 family F420-dependent LLM class oxidoreductase [Candidatus Binataceae bacterium]|nr:TIGR03619 family F420-dependent LLM class oxidoreductase [Candidatus Binataceae bacterium]